MISISFKTIVYFLFLFETLTSQFVVIFTFEKKQSIKLHLTIK